MIQQTGTERILALFLIKSNAGALGKKYIIIMYEMYTHNYIYISPT